LDRAWLRLAALSAPVQSGHQHEAFTAIAQQKDYRSLPDASCISASLNGFFKRPAISVCDVSFLCKGNSLSFSVWLKRNK
jgi:hypothetical protein